LSLIFLDTPQIGLLEEKRRTDYARYRSFCNAWKQRGCTLVFTWTQAGELTRYADAPRREGRSEVLADLAPIRTDFDPMHGESIGPRILMHREIMRALAERGLITAAVIGADRLAEWTDMLPGRLTVGHTDFLRMLMENEDYRRLESQMYDAARFAAAAMKSEGQSRRNVRVQDVPGTPVPPEIASRHRAEIENALRRLREESGLGNLPPMTEEMLSTVRAFSLGFADRAAKVGPREALLEQLPVARQTDAERLKLTTDELVRSWFFEFQIRFVVGKLLGAPEHQQDTFARALEFSDCPGSWLQWELELCVRRGTTEPRPSHQHDAERLAYLPYVDLLFTDRQMAQFVEQVRNDQSTPKGIRAAPPPVAISNSLTALERALGF